MDGRRVKKKGWLNDKEKEKRKEEGWSKKGGKKRRSRERENG